MTAAALARAIRVDNERIRRESCATCGERCAPFACAWRCERFQEGRLRDLVIGDIVRRFRDIEGRRPGRAVVKEIDNRPHIGKVFGGVGCALQKRQYEREAYFCVSDGTPSRASPGGVRRALLRAACSRGRRRRSPLPGALARVDGSLKRKVLFLFCDDLFITSQFGRCRQSVGNRSRKPGCGDESQGFESFTFRHIRNGDGHGAIARPLLRFPTHSNRA